MWNTSSFWFHTKFGWFYLRHVVSILVWSGCREFHNSALKNSENHSRTFHSKNISIGLLWLPSRKCELWKREFNMTARHAYFLYTNCQMMIKVFPNICKCSNSNATWFSVNRIGKLFLDVWNILLSK